MVFRVLAGFLAFLAILAFFDYWEGRDLAVAALMIFMAGVFLIYAIGGNKLANRISSFIKE